MIDKNNLTKFHSYEELNVGDRFTFDTNVDSYFTVTKIDTEKSHIQYTFTSSSGTTDSLTRIEDRYREFSGDAWVDRYNEEEVEFESPPEDDYSVGWETGFLDGILAIHSKLQSEGWDDPTRLAWDFYTKMRDRYAT